jgi:hypothetical protein
MLGVLGGALALSFLLRPEEEWGSAAEPWSKPSEGDYWALRASYPTGIFKPSWLARAAEQDRAVPRGLPAGELRPATGEAATALDPRVFTPLGPQPLDGSWPGSTAGRTNVIVVDPVDPTVAYLGSDGGGVWKTTNCCSAATVWAPTMDDPLMTGVGIGDIVLDPNDHETVYAGTGDLRYGSFSFGSAGLLKSTDQGATWTVLGADVFDPVYPEPPGVFPQYQAIGKVQVDPQDSANLIVGTKTGLYLSYDGGVNWTGPCLTNAHTGQRQDVTGLVALVEGGSTELVVAIGTRGFDTPVQPDLDLNGANGIYRGTLPASGCPTNFALVSRPDNGWPAGTGGGVPYPTNVLGRIDLGVAPSDPDTIYAQVAAIDTRGQLGVWRTTDGGTTWQQRSNVSGLTGCFGDWPQNWYDQGVAVDPSDPDTVFISTVDLFRSTNGGTTFVNLTCGYVGGEVHVDHHARAFVADDPSRLLVGSDGGVYYTDNADALDPDDVAFIDLNASLSTIELYSGDITADFAISGNAGVNGGAQDNGSSVFVWDGTPGPATWVQTLGGDGVYARIEPVLELRWYQESQNGALTVSTTGPFGNHTNAQGAWGSDRRSFLMPYELYRYDCPLGGCQRMIAGTYRVWETLSGAIPPSSWYVNSPDLTKGTLADRSFINQLAHSVTDPSIAIVGTNDGNVAYGFDLGLGVANSATWVDVTDDNAVLPNRPILDVATDPETPTIGYAAVGGFSDNTPATPGHVYRIACNTDCSSFTWEDKSGNLPDIPVDSIAVNPLLPQQIFAGTDWGLYFTDDVTAASPLWQKHEGLPSVMIWDMAIDRGFTTLAVFTRSRGAWAWPLPVAPAQLFADGFETGDTDAWDQTVQ